MCHIPVIAGARTLAPADCTDRCAPVSAHGGLGGRKPVRVKQRDVTNGSCGGQAVEGGGGADEDQKRER